MPAVGNPWSGEVPVAGGPRSPSGRRPVGNWEAADERWAVVESAAQPDWDEGAGQPPPDEPDDEWERPDRWPGDRWRRPSGGPPRRR